MRRLLLVALFALPLSASEIALAPPTVTQVAFISHVAAASDGVDALVVWMQYNSVVRYAMVRPAGGTGDIPVRVLPQAFGAKPLVAFAGGRYLIAWHGSRGTEGALLDGDGNVVRTIGPFGGVRDSVVLAGGNGRFLLAWRSSYEGKVAILSADGDVVSTGTFPTDVVAVCESAGGFAALLAPEYFYCAAGSCTMRQTLVRMASDGHVTGQFDDIRTVSDHSFPGSFAIASASDGGLVVAWEDGRDYHAHGFLTDYAFHHTSGDYDFSLSGGGPLTTMWDGAHYVVLVHSYGFFYAMRVGIDPYRTWQGWGPVAAVAKVRGGYIIASAMFDTISMAAIFQADLFTSASRGAVRHFATVEDQYRPAIATDGHSVLAGWRLGRIPWNSYALVSNGAVRPLANFLGDELQFDGKEFVVIGGCPWEDNGCEISPTTSQFLSVEGDAGTKVVQSDVPYVIWSGNVAFGFSGVNGALTVRRLNRAGAPIDTPPVVVQRNVWLESMATDGRDVYFITADNRDNFALARFTAEGALTMGYLLPFTSPRIAVAGDVVFVTGTSGDSIVVSSYTTDLRPRWPAAVELGPGEAPAIDASGRDAVVAWRDPGRGVFGARVAPEGSAAAFGVVATPDPIFDVRVAARGAVTAVAYMRAASEAPYLGASRMFVHVDAPPRRHASAP